MRANAETIATVSTEDVPRPEPIGESEFVVITKVESVFSCWAAKCRKHANANLYFESTSENSMFSPKFSKLIEVFDSCDLIITLDSLSSILCIVTYAYIPIEDANTSPPYWSTNGERSDPPPANEMRRGARVRTILEITV